MVYKKAFGLVDLEVDPKDSSQYNIVPAKSPMLVYHGFNFTSGLTYMGFHPALDKLIDGSPIFHNGYFSNDFTSIDYLKWGTLHGSSG